jgi:hypothetical protein
MKAENQSMLIEEAQGQQTIQALFMQTGKNEQPVILNCQFERDPEDGKLYYVYSGTADNYVSFRSLMEDYAVRPVHEIEGHRLNPKTHEAAAQAAGEAAPVTDTAPAETKSTADVGDNPPELSATEGEIVRPAPEGDADVASVRGAEQPADSGQPSAGDAGQAGAGNGGRVDAHGGGHAGEPGASDRGPGREAGAAGASGPVDAQGVKADPFADLGTTTAAPAAPAPSGKPDPFADL